MREILQQSHKFNLWMNRLKQNGLSIHDTEELYTRYNNRREALFSLVMLDAQTPEGDKIPPICFIKGEVVSLLICLIDRDTREKYLLLVKQRRICNGGIIYEHVAGMVDGTASIADIAIQEAKEEAGLDLTHDQIHLLNETPFYPTTGTSDEAMYLFYCEVELSKEEIFAYNQQEQGIISEHERIITHIATIDEAKKLITNTNGLLHIYLYLEHIAQRDSSE